MRQKTNEAASERLKWTVFEESPQLPSNIGPDTIPDLIDSGSLDAHFQPIFSARTGEVYAYEALARPRKTSYNISQLFQAAARQHILPALDKACCSKGLEQARLHGLTHGGAHLFLNICPETLITQNFQAGLLDDLVSQHGFDKSDIVLEITEESAVKDYQLFSRIISEFRKRGYRIAIDDFGAGYGGLKMLSVIEPDYVKIDRHFISHMDRALVRYNLVDLIITGCHRMGIKVIAEGVEREEDLNTLLEMDVGFLQGYLLARPEPTLAKKRISLPGRPDAEQSLTVTRAPISIGEIARRVDPVSPSSSALNVFQRFMDNAQLIGLPVVDGNQVLGMIHRHTFLEQRLLGKLGYGLALHAHKTAADLIKDHTFIAVDFGESMEDVSRRLQARADEMPSQNVCVTRQGHYYGVVTIEELLRAITERNLSLARAANPLTGLPGSILLQSETEKCISQNIHFSVSYIDIDHFKPFNDHHGFARGDLVLVTLAEIITEAARSYGDLFTLVGHIGGDDFILLSRPQHIESICRRIIESFEECRSRFHNESDLQRGFYTSRNRKGEEEKFNLLTLSIGSVSNDVQKIASYAQLSSLASEVKKAAKQTDGFAHVVDRRLISEARRG